MLLSLAAQIPARNFLELLSEDKYILEKITELENPRKIFVNINIHFNQVIRARSLAR